MKKYIKNPFFWTTIVLACTLCVLCGYQYWKYHVPNVIALDWRTMTDEDVPERYSSVDYSGKKYISNGFFGHSLSRTEAPKRDDIQAMRAILRMTGMREEMGIVPDTNPLLIFDGDAGKYYFVFYNTKRHCNCSITIDAYNYGVDDIRILVAGKP